MDVDESGFLTRDEVYLHFVGQHARRLKGTGGGLVVGDAAATLPLDVESVMDAHDTNGDGLVSEGEFAALC
jgi:hypothetical protein